MAEPRQDHPVLYSRIQDSEQTDLDNGDDETTAAADDDADSEEEVQPGVHDVEAVTLIWSTGTLVFAYVMVWLVYLVQGVLSGMSTMLAPYIVSDFSRHALTPTVGILSSVVGGVTNLTLAKILDVFGRPHGFLVCIVLAVLGLVTMALCGGVGTYAAAQVLLTVGSNGAMYSLTVFVSDTSSMRDRGLVQALISSSNLITCWLIGPLSLAALDGPGWRWAFGIFAALVPASAAPLFYLLLRGYMMARRLELLPKTGGQAGGTVLRSLLGYCRQFDAIGLMLLSSGVALSLLPFNIYTMQGWASPAVTGSMVIGCALLAAFVFWEKRYAIVTFVPYSLLLDRTVLGACVLSATLFVSFWCWNSFFSSYLQVVNDLSVQNAGFVVQSYTAASVLCSIAAGALIRYSGRFKPLCLYVGVPLSILGSGLMLHLLRTGGSVAAVTACQLAIAVAAGIIMVCGEVAILAATSHQYMAACLAILGVFGNIGGAIGLTMASAIWQASFPKSLRTHLPADELHHLPEIYASLAVQLSYPPGSDTRLAIQHAYRDTLPLMLCASTAVWAVGLVAVASWRDLNVIDTKQSTDRD